MLLTALLTLGLGFCLYTFILAPQARAYLSTRQELENARNKLASYRATAAALRDESEKLEKARAQAAILGKQFASDIGKGEDIVLLGLEAASRNVDITGVEPGGIKEQKYTLEMPLKIFVEGDFRDVLDFCRSLEKGALHNLTEVRGINMEGTDTPGRVKAEFSVVVYADRSPGSRLKLEEMGRWLTGRYNIFAPADGTAPVPELSGRLKGLPAPPGAGSSPASPAAGNTPELTGQNLPPGEKGTVAGEVYYFNK